MAVNIPTLKEIRDSIVNDLNASLGIFTAVFGKNFLNIFSGVLAAKLKLFYLTIADVQKNVAPDLADTEANGGTLERFGRLKLGRNPFAAINSIYSVSVTGEIGAVIKASTTFKSDDSSSNPGFLYVLDAEFTLTTSPELINLRSLDVGVQTRLAVTDTLTATSPILNVDSIVTVSSEVQEPLDAESIDDYREKVEESYRLEPQGGASSDYRLWSADAQGVRRSYSYAKSGQSAVVDNFVEASVIDSIDGKGTPSQSILDDVAAVIEQDPDITQPLEDRGRRPLGAFQVNVLPITALDVEIVIVGLSEQTPEIETTVTDSLTTYLDTVRPFVAGADAFENKNDLLTVTKLSFIVVSALPDNVFFNTITFKVNGVSSVTYQFVLGNIPFLNDVSFQ